ncbi:thermonuclease family protein, partial [Lysinibacillus sp. VIII_CA]|uniref:thermonuclease family protein n=1 Tax=Lysinibacillus sp. VIII_CA TaxID=3417452 RepID=UPI003CF5A3A3
EQVCLDASGARFACGATARDELAKHLGTQSVTCQAEHRENSERLAANCTVGGEDIGKWLIGTGWAIAGQHASKDYE